MYEHDVRLRRRQQGAVGGPEDGGGKRGRIVALSRASRSRLVLVARNSEPLKIFVTLTYPREFPADGRVVKAHLRAFTMRIRRRWPDTRGLWWLEFQQRGAPHFHLVLAGERSDVEVLREWVALAWYEVVGSGDPKHLSAGTSVEWWRSSSGTLGTYVAKEAAKWVQKQVPEDFENVGRFWGQFGGVQVPRRDVVAPRGELAPAVRVVRAAEASKRRRAGLSARSDGGVVGFTAYNAAPAVARWLAEGGGS